MYMPPKSYYDELEEETKRKMEGVDACARLAESYKHLYEITKNRRGLYRLINKWALKENQKWYDQGMKEALNHLGLLGYEIGQLNEYQKTFKYLEDKG